MKCLPLLCLFMLWALCGRAQQEIRTAASSTQINNSPSGTNWSTQNPINVPPANFYQQLQVAENTNKKILQIRIPTGSRSNTVVLNNFGFALPSNSMVGSVVATIYGRSQAEDSVVVYLINRKVTEGVTTLDTVNKSGGRTTGFLPANTFTALKLGEGSSALSYWGTTLSPAMVNNSSFGLAFWIKNIGGINNTTEIDSVSLTITYSIAVVAPVRFVSLVANKTTGGTELVWKVAAEENIERYDVEKSSDGNHFSTVGSRTAEGSAEYRYTQHSTFGDEGYYRIKALNRDGSKNYSTVVYAKNIGNNHALHVFPLPARSVITVVHEKASAGTKILLCNANGSVAKEIIPAINASETNINIAHLTPGIYFLQYATGNGAVESKRILKL